MLDALYDVVITPIYILIGILFQIINSFLCNNFGCTILFVSFVINLICLPLYMNAERLSKEEREIQKKLEPKVKSIKKNFKGDEKHMLLQTYYRQNNYHPLMSLRLSASLLLQIPFFLAAYLFFQNLEVLEFVSFSFINDLSKPDALFIINGFKINVLPILMTLINLYAGYIYANKDDKKENTQLLLMSLFFLVVLYNSPSALVLYWTYNNFFSLIKNIGLKSKNPKQILIYTTICVYTLFAVLAQLPYILLIIPIIYLIKKYIKFKINIDEKINIATSKIYLLGNIALFILIGFFLPSGVIATSPLEFSTIKDNMNPLIFIYPTILQAFGIFVFWGSCIYIFSSTKIKKILAYIPIAITIFFIINMIILKLPTYTLSNTLSFNAEEFSFYISTLKDKIVYYTCIVIAFIALTYLIIKNKTKTIISVIILIIFSCTTVSIANIYKINKIYTTHIKNKKEKPSQPEIYFSLSKNNQNVLVLFIDRAISSYLPHIFNEKPELKEKFSGFVYYPNTVSFSRYTLFAYPAMMGGYEYTCEKLANRKNELLVDKHNESILVLPLIFKNNGYDVTVSDATYGNYKYTTPPEIFTKHGINYKQVIGNIGEFYSRYELSDVSSLKDFLRENFIYFSFLITTPEFLREKIYNEGKYLNVTNPTEKRLITNSLLEHYAELHFLPQITEVKEKNKSFIIVNNGLPHEPSLLLAPEYTLNELIRKDNTMSLDYFSLTHYHVNVAALSMLSKYMQFLKDNNVYDNTRIIIIADHGFFVENPNLSKFQNRYLIRYNPLLMVKDFNSNEPFTTSNEFMTNADLATIATQGVIEKPINPFSNKLISSKEKENGVYINETQAWRPELFTDKYLPFMKKDQEFVHIKEDIYKDENWTPIMYSQIPKR